MSVFETLAAILAPFDCVGCGQEGDLLCQVCAAALPVLPARCYRCRKLTSRGQTCSSCRSSSSLYRVTAATVYDDAAKELVWRLKFSGAKTAANCMARQLLRQPSDLSEMVVKRCFVVPVPTATSRVRQRGYDQAKLLARAVCRQAALPYLDCLARHGQAHQVGASRQARLHQLTEAFRITKPAKLRGATIMLIDDVVTTGATLEAAAKTLKAAGAQRVEAMVFAQP